MADICGCANDLQISFFKNKLFVFIKTHSCCDSIIMSELNSKDFHVWIRENNFHQPSHDQKEMTHTVMNGKNGGTLYIPMGQRHREFLTVYASHILRNMNAPRPAPLYICELRTHPLFRYCIDLDFAGPRTVTNHELLLLARQIQLCLIPFYSHSHRNNMELILDCVILRANTVVIETERNHPEIVTLKSSVSVKAIETEDWESLKEETTSSRENYLQSNQKPLTFSDSRTITFKTGIHIIWPNLAVTAEQALIMRQSILSKLYEIHNGDRPNLWKTERSAQFEKSDSVLVDWDSWDDIFDHQIYTKTGLRMLGSDKFVRCSICKSRSSSSTNSSSSSSAGSSTSSGSSSSGSTRNSSSSSAPCCCINGYESQNRVYMPWFFMKSPKQKTTESEETIIDLAASHAQMKKYYDAFVSMMSDLTIRLSNAEVAPPDWNTEVVKETPASLEMLKKAASSSSKRRLESEAFRKERFQEDLEVEKRWRGTKVTSLDLRNDIQRWIRSFYLAPVYENILIRDIFRKQNNQSSSTAANSSSLSTSSSTNEEMDDMNPPSSASSSSSTDPNRNKRKRKTPPPIYYITVKGPGSQRCLNLIGTVENPIPNHNGNSIYFVIFQRNDQIYFAQKCFCKCISPEKLQKRKGNLPCKDYQSPPCVLPSYLTIHLYPPSRIPDEVPFIPSDHVVGMEIYRNTLLNTMENLFSPSTLVPSPAISTPATDANDMIPDNELLEIPSTTAAASTTTAASTMVSRAISTIAITHRVQSELSKSSEAAAMLSLMNHLEGAYVRMPFYDASHENIKEWSEFMAKKKEEYKRQLALPHKMLFPSTPSISSDEISSSSSGNRPLKRFRPSAVVGRSGTSSSLFRAPSAVPSAPTAAPTAPAPVAASLYDLNRQMFG
jgi:hypothetical protein